MTYTDDELRRIQAGYHDFQNLLKHVIRRANDWHALTGRGGDYGDIDVDVTTLFDRTQPHIQLNFRRNELGTRHVSKLLIPRSFVFDKDGEYEKTWREWRILEAQLQLPPDEPASNHTN